MGIFYAKLVGTHIKGYFREDYDGIEFCQSLYHIKVTQELHQYLITYASPELLGIVEDRIYTIEDKDLFKDREQSNFIFQEGIPNEERIAALETALMGVL